MRRGDIIRLNLNNPPGGAGHEQSGFRPAVVISSGYSDLNNSMVTIIPFTSNIRRANHPHTIIIDPSSENGLSLKSVLLAYQITSYDKRRVIDVIGSLEKEHMDNLEILLKNLLKI